MISLGGFAGGLNMLERSLLEDFLRGEAHHNRSKALAAASFYSHSHLPGGHRMGDSSLHLCVRIACKTLTEAQYATLSLQIGRYAPETSKSTTVSSASQRSQGRTCASMSGTSWGTT